MYIHVYTSEVLQAVCAVVDENRRERMNILGHHFASGVLYWNHIIVNSMHRPTEWILQ